MDNLNHWIYMRVNHPETAEYMENTSPPVKLFSPVLSFGGGISVREKEEKMIMGHRVIQLEKRQFYMRSDGKLYKGITADTSPAYVTVRFPDIRAS